MLAQGTAVLVRWSWIVLLLPPAFAFYKVMADYVVPYCLTPSAEELAQREKKEAGRRGRATAGRPGRVARH